LKDAAPRSIRAVLQQQQDVKGILLYLEQHGQKASSISLDGSSTANTVTLKKLPHCKLQGLTSLNLSRLSLQLSHPRSCRYQGSSEATAFEDAVGVLAGDVPLKRLKLDYCTLLDGMDGLAAALSLLPKLEHLSLVNNTCTYRLYASSEYPIERSDPWDFWGLGPRSFRNFRLEHLTYLEIEGVGFPGDKGSCLQGLTGLQGLSAVPPRTRGTMTTGCQTPSTPARACNT
jgi:hypothetical protein